MTEIKDTERELQLFRMRLSVAGLVVFICFGLLVARFVWLQIIQHNYYKTVIYWLPMNRKISQKRPMHWHKNSLCWRRLPKKPAN